jgi:Ty3 transposon capsid-like protein
MKFSGKDNEDISTFMECYGAEAELMVEGFKGWTEAQAISYLLGAVEGRALEVALSGVAILGERSTAKYVKVLNYLKEAFVDSVKSEKTLDKLTRITQYSDINTYIREFNTLRGQTSLTITILEATILWYFIQDLKMTICMAVAATRPNTLVAVQASAREMDMVAMGHGNNTKGEPIDTFVKSWDDKPKGTCN